MYSRHLPTGFMIQNRSSSLSFFDFLETFPRLPPWFDNSWLSQHLLFWFCQEPWIYSWRITVHEEARHKTYVKLLISSLNALVESAGLSLKTQPRLLLLPISSHDLTTATVSSWAHLILSSNLSRKFKTLLQGLFSWHLATNTQNLSWKNCSGFPSENVLSIKSLVCDSML